MHSTGATVGLKPTQLRASLRLVRSPAVAGSAGVEQQPGLSPRGGAAIVELPLVQIRRPLARTRSNDTAKVAALAASIAEIGLQEPIDVLEVEGVYYGFSGTCS